ncbi:hypothetical protein D3C78_1727850 [compost metagenome]
MAQVGRDGGGLHQFGKPGSGLMGWERGGALLLFGFVAPATLKASLTPHAKGFFAICLGCVARRQDVVFKLRTLRAREDSEVSLHGRAVRDC